MIALSAQFAPKRLCARIWVGFAQGSQLCAVASARPDDPGLTGRLVTLISDASFWGSLRSRTCRNLVWQWPSTLYLQHSLACAMRTLRRRYCNMSVNNPHTSLMLLQCRTKAVVELACGVHGLAKRSAIGQLEVGMLSRGQGYDS